MPSTCNILRSTAAVIIPFAPHFRDGGRGQSLASQARTSSALRQMYRNLADLPVPDRSPASSPDPRRGRSGHERRGCPA
jgi:hypothetical protein